MHDNHHNVEEEKKQEIPIATMNQVPRHRRSCASLCKFALSPITSCIRYAWNNKIVTTIALLSTASAALYSLTFLSGKQPQDINSEWWYSMSDAIQFCSVMNACISITVNLLTSTKYLPLAGVKLKKNLTHTCESPSLFIKNNICLLVGLSVGLIYGTQSYNAFLWTNISLSIISGITNFLSYSARRYNSIVDLIEKFKDLFNSDVRFQQECIKQLYHLKPEYVEEFNLLFHDKPINEESVNLFLTTLYDKATEALHKKPVVSLFYEKTRTDLLRDVLHMTARVGVGLFCAIAAIPIGIQNAYDGIQLLLPKNVSDNLTNANDALKVLIGVVPGLANGIFYFISGYECSESLEDMYDAIRENKKYLITSSMALVLNALTATGYYVIAQATVNESNILNIQAPTSLGNALPIIYATAVFITGVNNTDGLFAKVNPIVHRVGDITEWLERHKLPSEKISVLRRHAFFSPKASVTKAADDIELIPSGLQIV